MGSPSIASEKGQDYADKVVRSAQGTIMGIGTLAGSAAMAIGFYLINNSNNYLIY